MGCVRTAGGKRGDPERIASNGNRPALRRQLQAPTDNLRMRVRLDARDQLVVAGVLQVDAVVLPDALQTRSGLPRDRGAWWCDKCRTILANEQVVNGCCWRHPDSPVSKKDLEQWYIKITDYADRLLADLDGIDWPEPIKLMQRNWIGRSEGAELAFPVPAHAGKEVRFFTTRPDTVFGVSFMVLAPEHPLVAEIT